MNYPAASGRASGFGEQVTPLSTGVGIRVVPTLSAVPKIKIF